MKVTEEEFKVMQCRKLTQLSSPSLRHKFRAKPSDELSLHCEAFGIPIPTMEFRFHPNRRWRVDYAWPGLKLAVEVEGGVFIPGGSRHSRGAGYRNDLDKYNELAIMGWTVLRFLPEQVKTGEAAGVIARWGMARLRWVLR